MKVKFSTVLLNTIKKGKINVYAVKYENINIMMLIENYYQINKNHNFIINVKPL